MGWLDWLWPGDRVCSRELKPLFSAFVDAVVDSAAADAPASAAPRYQPHRHKAIWPATQRLVAIGDVHGDIEQMKKSLQAAGIVDDTFAWCGGNATLVQVGDQLDRGDTEIEVLFALERLQKEARQAGGALHVLNGNHETMNIAQDLRYATADACKSFARLEDMHLLGAALKRRCKCTEGWTAVPKQTAPGLHPEHVENGLDALNDQAQDWLMGKVKRRPDFISGPDAVVWTRDYSRSSEANCKCDMLRETLSQLDASRMVVGHTIQTDGINGVCDGQVLRVDVGMSRGCYGAEPQALEIAQDKLLYRVLADGTRIPLNDAAKQAQHSQPQRVQPLLHSEAAPVVAASIA